MGIKMYHGTSSGRLHSILKRGLSPRINRKGNWREFPSLPGHVYLTNSYAPYFASNAAAKRGEKFGHGWMVIEVDLDLIDKNRLFPDEDGIAQLLANMHDVPMGLAHEHVCDHIEEFQTAWEDMLERSGNCSYRGVIPPEAITKITLFDMDPAENALGFAMMALDPYISLANYHFTGEKQRLLNKWFAGYDLTDDDIRVMFSTVLMLRPEDFPKIREYIDSCSGCRRDVPLTKSIVVAETEPEPEPQKGSAVLA